MCLWTRPCDHSYMRTYCGARLPCVCRCRAFSDCTGATPCPTATPRHFDNIRGCMDSSPLTWICAHELYPAMGFCIG